MAARFVSNYQQFCAVSLKTAFTLIAASGRFIDVGAKNLHKFRLLGAVVSYRELARATWMEANLKRTFLKFLADESGATAIEYGLIAAGIALAIIAAVNGLGTTLEAKFTSINGSLK